jgi:hypothetical protein
MLVEFTLQAIRWQSESEHPDMCAEGAGCTFVPKAKHKLEAELEPADTR